MPTILRQDGFRFMTYPNDHLPMHVHAIHGEGETLIALGNANVAPSVYENRGLSARLERRALEIVGENQELMIREWERIHG